MDKFEAVFETAVAYAVLVVTALAILSGAAMMLVTILGITGVI